MLNSLDVTVDDSKKRSNQLILVFLFVLSLIVNILLGALFYTKPTPPPQQLPLVAEKTEPNQITPPNETQTEPLQPDYARLELSLLTQSNPNTQAASKLFGFKFNSFHKDWDCNIRQMMYTPEGIVVSCNQKPCSISRDLQYPENINQEKSAECAKELASREFSAAQLPRLTINVEKVVSDKERVFETNATTPRGRAYKFEEVAGNKYQTGYIKQLRVTFYSPKELTNLLSNLGGTFYGADYVYAKYSTEVDIYENPEGSTQAIEEKIIALIEKMIDSIEFTKPVE
jgi:hypothetical protein